MPVQNVVLFGLGMAVGELKDSTGDFHASLWCMLAVAAAGLVAAVGVKAMGLPVAAWPEVGGGRGGGRAALLPGANSSSAVVLEEDVDPQAVDMEMIVIPGVQ